MQGNDRPESETSPTAFCTEKDSQDLTGNKRFAPAAARNADVICEVLASRLVENAKVLEIGSGSGQHVVAFAQMREDVNWQPSDVSAEARQSVHARIVEEELSNACAPLELDLLNNDWGEVPETTFQAIVCINVIHITPWQVCQNLMKGASQLLTPDGLLYLYGPYKEGGIFHVQSNAEFDRSLRQRNSEWGVRDVRDVTAEAALNGFSLAEKLSMPTNNLSLMYRRTDYELTARSTEQHNWARHRHD